MAPSAQRAVRQRRGLADTFCADTAPYRGGRTHHEGAHVLGATFVVCVQGGAVRPNDPLFGLAFGCPGGRAATGFRRELSGP